MANLTRPEDIIVEFLRARLTDPRDRHTSDSDSFTATAAQTEFTLTPTTETHLVRAIVSVVQQSVTLKKWQDYYVDLVNKKVTLLTGATVADAVVISYKTSVAGDEWIYPDKPIAALGSSKFPRISVSVINKTGDRLGVYSASLLNRIHFQVDCWTKEGYSKTISSANYEEQNLADYLGHQVEAQLSDYIDDLYPKLGHYAGLAFGEFPFGEDTQTFRHKQEFVLEGVDAGH